MQRQPKEPHQHRHQNLTIRCSLWEHGLMRYFLWANEKPFPHRAHRHIHNDSAETAMQIAQPLLQDRGLSIQRNVTISKTTHPPRQMVEYCSSDYSPHL